MSEKSCFGPTFCTSYTLLVDQAKMDQVTKNMVDFKMRKQFTETTRRKDAQSNINNAFDPVYGLFLDNPKMIRIKKEDN